MKEKPETTAEFYNRFKWEIPDAINLGSLCCDVHAFSGPDETALIEWSEGGQLHPITFGQLRAMSNRLANALEALGAVAGDRVSIILPQCLQCAISHLAIFKSAMISVPLARLFAPEALAYRLGNSQSSIVITNQEGAAKIAGIRNELPHLKHVINIDTAMQGEISWDKLLEEAGEEFEAAETGPHTPALIIFTSGTTGPPKGALHGHRIVHGHMPGIKTHHEMIPQKDDRLWTPADWAWAGGLLNVLLPGLMLKVPVVFGGMDRFDPVRAMHVMGQAKVRNAFIPPTALRLMKSTIEEMNDEVKLRTIGTGGESLGVETHRWCEKQFGLKVNEFYGQTECNLVLSCCGAAGVMRAGSIGKPVPGHKVAVIDGNGTICPPEVPGQIAIKRPDPVQFLGYWDNEEATRQKYLGDWMLTGDRGLVDLDGYFHFVGRDDDIINVAGYRVGPGEIEDCLGSHPAVRLAVAVGKPDPLKGEVVKAFVVLNNGFEPGIGLEAEIKSHVKIRLAANIFPREVEFVDEIPLTTTGKVIRRHFREQERRPGQDAETGS
jgi:acetyl-CoA synthetase